jgi:hypothetical protein
MHRHKKEWFKSFNERGTYYKKANRRIFQINSYYMNEADIIIFKNFKTKFLSKGGTLFFSFINIT